ncbi:MAG: hypothetical protein J1E06_01225 [Acutalibacter sp.]|nr:hypothetical protein [Acutalibacter sp.]
MGTTIRLPVTTPAKDLIAAAEIDYRKYRGEIKRLRDEHPLFENRLDISEADFEDLVAEALLLPAMLEKIDPVSFFVLGELLRQSLQADVEPGQRIFRVNSILGLRLLELTLYFQQDAQRIARCDYCWGWFIPKTKKVTRYCDRVTDGFPCKQRGSRFKRNLIEEQDSALRTCNQLRDRMYARFLRWQDAAPTERDNLIPMDYAQYTGWSENARLARMEYLSGKLTAEEFLRRIDMTHELKNYEADKVELMEETVWQRMVACDLGFDAEAHYPETMQTLDLGAEKPQWELRTADELRREDQQGHQSLREKYGKG